MPNPLLFSCNIDKFPYVVALLKREVNIILTCDDTSDDSIVNFKLENLDYKSSYDLRLIYSIQRLCNEK